MLVVPGRGITEYVAFGDCPRVVTRREAAAFPPCRSVDQGCAPRGGRSSVAMGRVFVCARPGDAQLAPFGCCERHCSWCSLCTFEWLCVFTSLGDVPRNVVLLGHLVTLCNCHETQNCQPTAAAPTVFASTCYCLYFFFNIYLVFIFDCTGF